MNEWIYPIQSVHDFTQRAIHLRLQSIRIDIFTLFYLFHYLIVIILWFLNGITFTISHWSILVMLYQFAFGTFPSLIIQSCCYWEQGTGLPIPNHSNDSLRSLLAQLLKYEPEERITIPQVCVHPFFLTPLQSSSITAMSSSSYSSSASSSHTISGFSKVR